jgi:hypothetical protein
LAVINSGFFLWLISALFLTFGSALYQGRLQCNQESAKQRDTLAITQEEINDRIFFFLDVASKAKSPQEFNAALRARRPLYDQFRNKTLLDLTRDQKSIASFLSSEDASKVQSATGLVLLTARATDAYINAVDAQKLAILKAFSGSNDETPPIISVGPNCSLAATVRQMLLGRDDYLRVTNIISAQSEHHYASPQP